MNVATESIAKAAFLGWGLTMSGMPAFLCGMRKLGWGQPIREEGPQDHHKKSGTPTMGGGLFVPAGLLASLWCLHWSWDLAALWVITLGGWLLGLSDDITKVFRNRNLGLKARHKLLAQSLLALAISLYVGLTTPHPGVWLPGIGFVAGIGWTLLVGYFVVVSTTNAVNLTDGQDGLAAGTVVSALAVYVVVACLDGHTDLAVGAAGLLGAVVAFLWYNCYPARIFMGDTGSMGLGGALAGMALMTHTEFLLVVVGGVFVLEALSVVLQVSYFKYTRGKRIFRMSPIHHHFCLGGLHEVQVTTRFWVASVVLGALGLYLHLGGLL